jgi:hypothetical protein
MVLKDFIIIKKKRTKKKQDSFVGELHYPGNTEEMDKKGIEMLLT